MAQVPRLLGFLDTTVLDETAVVIIIKGLQRLVDRGVRQEHRFATRTIVLPTPLPHHHGSDGVAREVTPIRLARMLWGPIWVIARQACDPDHLGFQLRAPCRLALAMAHDVHAATDREVFPR